MKWNTVCSLHDILPGTGVCAQLKTAHVAIFRPEKNDQLFALSNIDPLSGSSVMSRGLIGDKNGEFYLASPLLKQRYLLASGQCLDNDDLKLTTFEVRVQGDKVQIKL
ncbi:nitrite reductase small subunit NirD [Endozoicomonas sp.]|uniref:nitrite reductase small subunit NirD n=1 Tax=Endozoicomonas sp. TaxID=1892382 RepID=UPI00383AA3A6